MKWGKITLNNNEIVLNFFGYVISVKSNDDDVISQIAYIYKDYLELKKQEIAYYFYIENKKKCKFVMSELLNNESIVVYHGKESKHMMIWKEQNTFLPPITAPYFRTFFSFYHGCALRIQNRTIVIFGPSLSGKTTLIMKCLDKGAHLISDDIVIIDNLSNEVLPFKKPIGIRNTSEYHKEERIIQAINKKTKSVPTFTIKALNITTELIHISEILGWNYYDKSSNIDEIYFINSNEEFEILDSFYEFYTRIIKQACISNDNLGLMIDIYKKLKKKPMLINIRNYKKMWEVLNL